MVHTDIHDAMDKIEASQPQAPLPPAGQDRTVMMNFKKGKRLLKFKLVDPEGTKSPPAQDAAPVEEELPANVVLLRPHAPVRSPSASEPQEPSAARAP